MLSFLNASPQDSNHTRFSSVCTGSRISTELDANPNNTWSITLQIESAQVPSQELNGNFRNLYHPIVLSHRIMCSAPWCYWKMIWILAINREIHTNYIIIMHAFIRDPEFSTVSPTWIKEDNINRMMNGWKWEKVQRCRSVPFIFLGFFFLNAQNMWHGTGQHGRLLAYSRRCVVATFLPLWDLAHSCRPDSVIHSSSDCKSKEGESKERDSDHNPPMASDVPGSLSFLPLLW